MLEILEIDGVPVVCGVCGQGLARVGLGANEACDCGHHVDCCPFLEMQRVRNALDEQVRAADERARLERLAAGDSRFQDSP